MSGWCVPLLFFIRHEEEPAQPDVAYRLRITADRAGSALPLK
jgi:hypothetical protein